jgi:hypothetical protein
MSDAAAQPYRANSLLCPNVCPAGDGTFVILRDSSNNPVPGVTVTLDYSSPAVKDLLEWCEVPPETLYTAVTGGNGKAFFPPAAGKHAPSGVVTLLFSVPWDADEPSPGFDLDGNQVVDAADETLLTSSIGGVNYAADYNCDNLITLADYAAFVQHMGHACAGGGTGAVPPGQAGLIGLGPIYPNPFAGRAVLTYSLASPGWTRLFVYDVSGRLVARLVERMDEPGSHSVEWDGRSEGGRRLASGVYMARLESSSRLATRWVVLSR